MQSHPSHARAHARAFFIQNGAALTLPFLLFMIAALLWPAINGGFLFDDEPNLSHLGAYGGVASWETLRAYLVGGFAGPTGRPLSLLSFLLDDFTWPTEPENFKRTNLFLHLLNVVLLTWVTLKLTSFYGVGKVQAAWIALATSAFWGLHPFLISTTFYVVQRMALLATTFCLGGLLAYLHGRNLWPEAPKKGLIWMGSGVAVGTVLATLAKENGALLPLLALTIEFCAPPSQPALPRFFRWAFLSGPSLALVLSLGRYLDFAERPWPERPFNQIERLLTEARILWDYLGQWFLPRIEGAGLFRDGIAISRSFWDPPETALAVLGLAVLLATALWFRRHLPFVSLALLFFFAGHLVESTWLGLELYFEHRNYLPSLFLFLPLATALTHAVYGNYRWLAGVFALALLVWLAFFSWQRAKLWSDPVKLEIYWAMAAPESPRAITALARRLFNDAGNPAEALRLLDEGIARYPNSGLLLLTRLLLLTQIGATTEQTFAEAAQQLQSSPFDAQVIRALRHLTDLATERSDLPSVVQNGVRLLIETLQTNSNYNQFPLFRRFVPYLLARLALAQQEIERAEALYKEAMDRYGDIDAAMQMVAEMGNAGHPDSALRLLAAAEEVLARQKEQQLKFSRPFYQHEIARIRLLLTEDRDKVKGD